MNPKVDGSPTPLPHSAQRNVANVWCHQWQSTPKLGSLVLPEVMLPHKLHLLLHKQPDVYMDVPTDHQLDLELNAMAVLWV